MSPYFLLLRQCSMWMWYRLCRPTSIPFHFTHSFTSLNQYWRLSKMYVDMNRRSCSTRRLHDLYITMCVHLVGAMVLQRHTCSNHLFPWMIDTGCSAVNQLPHHNVHLPTTECGKQGDRTSPYWHRSQTHTSITHILYMAWMNNRLSWSITVC